MITYLNQIIGRAYTPVGDYFGGADWEYIFASIFLVLGFWCVCKLTLSIFNFFK